MANDVFSYVDDIKVEFYIPAAGTWVWSVSTWDSGDVWGDAAAALDWRDLLCELVSIEITKGCDVDSQVLVAPGHGTARVVMQSADYDPGNHGAIHIGTPVRISYRPYPDSSPAFWQQIYAGQVESFATTYDRWGNTNIQIGLRDAMRDFLNKQVTSFSVGSYSGTMLTNMVTLGYYTGAYNFDPGTSWGTFYTQTLTNTTIGEIVNIILNGSLGYLWIGQDETMYFMEHQSFDNILDLGPTWLFSNIHSTDPYHICMSDLKVVADSAVLPNTLRANYSVNNGTQATKTYPDSIALYGTIQLEVDTYLANTPSANTWLDAISLNKGSRRVETVTFQPIQRDGTDRGWHLSDQLFTVVNVEYVNTGINMNEDYVVTRQIDTITRESWDTTLELWRGI